MYQIHYYSLICKSTSRTFWKYIYVLELNQIHQKVDSHKNIIDSVWKYIFIIYVFVEEPSDLAMVEAPVGDDSNPKNIDIELDIGTRNKKIQLHLKRNDDLNMDATVFVPRVDYTGKSVLVKEMIPVDTVGKLRHNIIDSYLFLLINSLSFPFFLVLVQYNFIL